jgi:hypothetical protein
MVTLLDFRIWLWLRRPVTPVDAHFNPILGITIGLEFLFSGRLVKLKGLTFMSLLRQG